MLLKYLNVFSLLSSPYFQLKIIEIYFVFKYNYIGTTLFFKYNIKILYNRFDRRLIYEIIYRLGTSNIGLINFKPAPSSVSNDIYRFKQAT